MTAKTRSQLKEYFRNGDIPTETDFADLIDSFLNLEFEEDWYNDYNFEAVGLGAGASAPDLITLFGSGNIQGRAFDGNATTEQLYGGSEILHGWAEGTSLYPHIHWMPTTTASGNVKFSLEYSWIDVDGVFSAPTTIAITPTAAGGVAWKHKLTSFPTIVGTGLHIGSHFSFRLFRNPTDPADTYGDDAVLLSFGIHFKTNTVGSRSISSK